MSSEKTRKILVIGSGPTVIGQGAEFDYAGIQACLALKELQYEVVLINSNPASLMTDPMVADKVYIEPLTIGFVSRILRKERPDGLLATFGGDAGIRLANELEKSNLLRELDVELLGTPLKNVALYNDREKLKEFLKSIDERLLRSAIVTGEAEALAAARKIAYPVIIRPAQTAEGSGSFICSNELELKKNFHQVLFRSPIRKCMIEKSIAGFKEIELEGMRDKNGHEIIVCSMENFDPVGIHQGDSIVIVPCQTLTDKTYQLLRNTVLGIMETLEVVGCCSVKFAIHPLTAEFYVLEINPFMNRSAALASKTSGYPIGKIAAKLATGVLLTELANPIAPKIGALFEPVMDYIAVKIPRWASDRFQNQSRQLGTEMKATGEVVGFGRNFEMAFLKAFRSLNVGTLHPEAIADSGSHEIFKHVVKAQDDRLLYLMEALRQGYTLEDLYELTKIEEFFLGKLRHIVELEKALATHPDDLALLKTAKRYGFSDEYIAESWHTTPDLIRKSRLEAGISAIFKAVDSCAGEYPAAYPYYYSCYEKEEESISRDLPKVLIIGAGPNQIGQGIEFDYTTIHAVKAVQNAGFQAIVLNNNPEALSTDFCAVDKLYFGAITIEEILNIIALEKPHGVILQFGGQTTLNLGQHLLRLGIKVLGTTIIPPRRGESPDVIEEALSELAIPHPMGGGADTCEEALAIAERLGFPVIVRPQQVLGGKGLEVLSSKEDLAHYVAAYPISATAPVFVNRFLSGYEAELELISDGEHVMIPGILEHIERASVHSGDSIAVYPAQTITEAQQQKMCEYATRLAKKIRYVGIMNIQFVKQGDEIQVMEVNTRANRTVPFLSKVTGLPLVAIATRVILGEKLKDMGYREGLYPHGKMVYVKAPVFSFLRLEAFSSPLGLQMKSTGEVMGSDYTIDKALYKAFEASGLHLPSFGTALFTISDDDKANALEIARRFSQIGFTIVATPGTADYFTAHGLITKPLTKETDPKNQAKSVIHAVQEHQAQIVINTDSTMISSMEDGTYIRRAALENGIPLFTSLDTASAVLNVLEARAFATEAI